MVTICDHYLLYYYFSAEFFNMNAFVQNKLYNLSTGL